MVDASPGDTHKLTGGANGLPSRVCAAWPSEGPMPWQIGRSLLSAKNNWGQAVPASSWFLVGDADPLLMHSKHGQAVFSCAAVSRLLLSGAEGVKGKEQGDKERQDTTTEDQHKAGQGCRENAREMIRDPPTTPALARRTFPNKSINTTRQARSRDRQS